MEHPFMNDISNKTLEQLQKDISKLNSNLTFAMRMGNMDLVNQISMILESYRAAHSAKTQEAFKKLNLENRVNVK